MFYGVTGGRNLRKKDCFFATKTSGILFQESGFFGQGNIGSAPLKTKKLDQLLLQYSLLLEEQTKGE